MINEIMVSEPFELHRTKALDKFKVLLLWHYLRIDILLNIFISVLIYRRLQTFSCTYRVVLLNKLAKNS